MSLDKSVEGRKTPLGHTDTHNWHAVQCCAKCRRLNAPGGSICVVRSGTFLFSITASPPSTVFSWAFRAVVAVVAKAVMINVRREVSFSCAFELLVVLCFGDLRAMPKLIASNSQLSMQFMQSAQRL